MISFFWRPPCRDHRRGDARLSALLDGAIADHRLSVHLSTCASCAGALAALRSQRDALRSLGDAPGAEPTDAGFHRVMAALGEERDRRPRTWMMLAAGAAVLVVGSGLGARQVIAERARRSTDDALVAGADAAFRRAEREYDHAVELLRARLSAEHGGTPDPLVEQGAHALEEARQKAAALVTAKRGDPEREALLRTALRAEVRYYEDALLRIEASAPVARP